MDGNVRIFIEQSKQALRTTTRYRDLDDKGRQAYRDGFVKGYLKLLCEQNSKQKNKKNRLPLLQLERRAGNAGDEWIRMKEEEALRPAEGQLDLEEYFIIAEEQTTAKDGVSEGQQQGFEKEDV